MKLTTTHSTFEAIKAEHGERYAETAAAMSRLYALIPGLRHALIESHAPEFAHEAAINTIAGTLQSLCKLGGFVGQERQLIEDAESLISGARTDIAIHKAMNRGGAAAH